MGKERHLQPCFTFTKLSPCRWEETLESGSLCTVRCVLDQLCPPSQFQFHWSPLISCSRQRCLHCACNSSLVYHVFPCHHRYTAAQCWHYKSTAPGNCFLVFLLTGQDRNCARDGDRDLQIHFTTHQVYPPCRGSNLDLCVVFACAFIWVHHCQTPHLSLVFN